MTLSSLRTRLPALLALSAGLLLLAAPAHATRYAGEFLRVGVGARALGMGSAFAGLADDGTAAYWNPAGLATLDKHEVQAMHAEQFGSIVQYDYLSYSAPLGAPGKAKQGLAVSLIRLGVDESRFVFDSDNDVALLFSYAREVSRGFSLGGNLKLVHQWLGDSLRSNGFGLDVGALYLGPHGWSAGAKLSDATTTRILWNTGTDEFIAPSLRLGFAKTTAFSNRKHIITAAFDVDMGFSDEQLSSQANLGSVTFVFHPGLEYWLERKLALRTGFEGKNFAAGTGFRFKKFGLDYAYLDHQDLDSSHRISASYAF